MSKQNPIRAHTATNFRYFSDRLLGSLLGMLLIGMIRNGLVIIGVSIYLLIVVSGLIVIAAVAVNLLVDRNRKAGERR